jgi:hypothetical protein
MPGAVFVSSASADPTSPGTASTAGAVYGTPPPNAPDVLGEQPPGAVVDPAVPLGETPPSTPDTASPSGTTTPVADQVAPSEESVKSIPFTGFAALVVLGIGVALVAGGALLRAGARERHAAA